MRGDQLLSELTRCVPTTEGDIETIIALERSDENAPHIRQWSRAMHVASISNPNVAHLAVRTGVDERIVGYVILVGLQDPDDSIEFKRLVIGDKGHGYGKSAVAIVKRLAFDELHAHRLWLEVIPSNTRAVGLYESAGFVHEGVHRESIRRGKDYDSLNVMSLLAREYDQILKAGA
jgi:RimJ/RimL family protein N-acetyltransferase